jgi:hypothetical protein
LSRRVRGQSPEDTVAASTDDTEATNPVDRPSRKRRRPLHARITPSGPKRRRPVAEIIHPEKDQDTAPPPPLSQSAPKTVSAIIKATEDRRGTGVAYVKDAEARRILASPAKPRRGRWR